MQSADNYLFSYPFKSKFKLTFLTVISKTLLEFYNANPAFLANVLAIYYCIANANGYLIKYTISCNRILVEID